MVSIASRVKSFFSPSTKTAVTQSTGTFQGPVQPGVSEQTFRSTGTSVQVSSVPTTTSTKKRSGGGPTRGPTQGPVQAGVSEEQFRKTGISEQVASLPTKGATISQQLQEPKQSQVGLPSTSVEKALALGRDVQRPSPKFDPELFKKAGREFFFLEGTPITAAGTLASPLQRFFPDRKGEKEIFIPQFGTISTEQPTGLKITTPIQLQREQALLDPGLLVPSEVKVVRAGERIQKELVAELQLQVTSGVLTVKEAEVQFEEQFTKRFEEQKLEPELKRRQEFISEFGRGREPVIPVKKAAELGAIGVGSLTPLGTAFVSSSFVAEGIPKIVGGETLLERGLGGLEAGIGLVGGGLAVKQVERAADVLLVSELQSQRALVTGRETARFEGGILFKEAPELEGGVIGTEIEKGAEGAVFDITSLRQFGEEAKIVTKLRTPVFKTGEETFAVTGGRGKSTLEFFSVEKGKPIKVVEEFSFGGRQAISKEVPRLKTKDLIIDLEDFQASFGTGFVQKKGREEFTKFGFGGISKDVETQVGKITQVQAGQVKGIRLEGTERLLRGGTIFKRVKGKVPIEEAGVIKRLTLPGTELDVGIISPAKIKKTPFQTTFQELKIQPPIGISKGIEEQTFKAPTKLIPPEASRSLVGIPRAVGGEGLTEAQIQRGQGGLVQQGFEQPLLTPPISRQGALQFDFVQTGLTQKGIQTSLPRLGILEKTLQSGRVGQAEIILQAPKTGLIEEQITGQKTRQFEITETITEQIIPPAPKPPKLRTPIDTFKGFDFPTPFILPPLPSLGGAGEKPKPKKSRKPRIPTRPSFTGIILEIEEAAFVDPKFGVFPGQIRGLQTGFEVPKKGKSKKKKRKKKKT